MSRSKKHRESPKRSTHRALYQDTLQCGEKKGKWKQNEKKPGRKWEKGKNGKKLKIKRKYKKHQGKCNKLHKRELP